MFNCRYKIMHRRYEQNDAHDKVNNRSQHKKSYFLHLQSWLLFVFLHLPNFEALLSVVLKTIFKIWECHIVEISCRNSTYMAYVMYGKILHEKGTYVT